MQNDRLATYIQQLDASHIPKERAVTLDGIVEKLCLKIEDGQSVNLNFICTHNSRRSQFAQVWMQTLAAKYKKNIMCYSGGVEVTTCNKRTIAALKAVGFPISASQDSNTIYKVTYDDTKPVIELYSKLYDHKSTPSGFVAIMTCDHADQNCPFIPNASERWALKYVDPKAFDNSPREQQAYLDTSLLIATEINYILSHL
ncbi:MAG: arsenate reductase [Bacteroidia bacterium]|jgi:arsenate reductase